ncbi:MAG: hypothetical protein V1792_22060 [Pseudomonadota bacterium]
MKPRLHQAQGVSNLSILIRRTRARFLKLSKQRRGLQEQLGYERTGRAYSAYVDGLMPLAEKIEKLGPVGGNLDQANPEY